jgi:hypothetical protein
MELAAQGGSGGVRQVPLPGRQPFVGQLSQRPPNCTWGLLPGQGFEAPECSRSLALQAGRTACPTAWFLAGPPAGHTRDPAAVAALVGGSGRGRKSERVAAGLERSEWQCRWRRGGGCRSKDVSGWFSDRGDVSGWFSGSQSEKRWGRWASGWSSLGTTAEHANCGPWLCRPVARLCQLCRISDHDLSHIPAFPRKLPRKVCFVCSFAARFFTSQIGQDVTKVHAGQRVQVGAAHEHRNH